MVCMNMKTSVFVTIFSLAVTARGLWGRIAPENPVDMKCVQRNCNDSYVACMDDRICVDNVGCVTDCWKVWDKDATPQKYGVQNCTNKCTASFDDYIYDDAIKCLSGYKCINFPPIQVTCKAPDRMKKNISLSQLQGNWFNLKGYHPVYDCYPCQKYSFQMGSPFWSYKASYQAYYTDGSLKSVSQSGSAESNSPSSGFNISFIYAGLTYNSTWWVFDSIEDAASSNEYYLVYYCGHVLEWGFEGALVLSKAATFPESATPAIVKSFSDNVGLNFALFCSPSVTDCPDNSQT